MIEPMEEVPAPNCEVCHRDPESDPEYGGCICPECRICGVVGDPKCWREHFPSAPQAQEEPSGDPAPAGSVPVEGRDVSPDGTTVVRGYRTPDGVIHITGQEHIPPPQPPAPASPGWREPVDVDDARRLARLRGEIDYPEAAPEAGAPGTQTRDGGAHG